MESLKQSKVIDCHDSAKAESRNDAWDSVIVNEVKRLLRNQPTRTCKSIIKQIKQ